MTAMHGVRQATAVVQSRLYAGLHTQLKRQESIWVRPTLASAECAESCKCVIVVLMPHVRLNAEALDHNFTAAPKFAIWGY